MFLRTLRRSFTQELEIALESTSNGVFEIHLQRHKRKNALGKAFMTQLNEALDKIAATSEARAVILKSKVPGIFCAGADLKERLEMSESEVRAFGLLLRSTFSKIEDLPIPAIACIEGYALGGGLEMALACDLRVATPESTLGLPETSLAIIPGAGGTYRLPKLIGQTRAKEMIFTANRYPASQLEKYGMIYLGLLNEVTDNAYERCQEIAKKIASNVFAT